MNYGETLTYWYLRLNGFIPMRNFVLHRANIEGQAAADTDLLAVRFPHVYEEIGGNPLIGTIVVLEHGGLIFAITSP
jgi:hypothetical protein